MGGKESKRKRQLIRQGLDPAAAAARAAEEFADVRKKQQEIEEAAVQKAISAAKKERLKKKRLKKAELGEEGAKLRERVRLEAAAGSKASDEDAVVKKRKKAAKAEVAAEAADAAGRSSTTAKVAGSEGTKKRKKAVAAEEAEEPEVAQGDPVVKRKRKKNAKAEAANESEVADGANQKPRGDPWLTVFVGQLPYTATAQSVKDHFVNAGIAGEVSVRLLTEKGTNKSRGMAFVQLASEEDVSAALGLHQSELDGRWINVERSVGKRKRAHEAGMDKKPKVDRALSVFVAQLPYSADADSIREHFENAGVEGVVSVKTLSEKGTNKKGMAFVQLASEAGVSAALKLHQSDFAGRSINVERSGKKEAKHEDAEDEEAEEQ